MNNILKNYCVIMIFSALNVQAQEILNTKYNIKDLEILEKERNYKEFFIHAYDLRPSERSKYWKKIFSNMALISIEEKTKNKDFSEISFLEIEKLGKDSQLVEDEVFQNSRNNYAINYFRECFNENIDRLKCENKLSVHWENSSKDPEAALKYVAFLENYKSNIDTWTFYNSIVNDSIAPLYCKKPEVQRAIVKKLTNETFKDNFNGNYRTIIGKHISNKCIEVLYPTLKDALTSTITNGLDKELALNVLWQMKQLSDGDKEFYLVAFLFSGPVVGDKMNLAWKLVESLSENYTKRMNILDRFKQLQLIPDNLFNDPNLPRSKSIISLFSKNFPEILNYYGLECLDFIKGKELTHIPSAHNCHQFLSQSGVKWVTDSISTEYSALKK